MFRISVWGSLRFQELPSTNPTLSLPFSQRESRRDSSKPNLSINMYKYKIYLEEPKFKQLPLDNEMLVFNNIHLHLHLLFNLKITLNHFTPTTKLKRVGIFPNLKMSYIKAPLELITL